jgi:hypothetical protein
MAFWSTFFPSPVESTPDDRRAPTKSPRAPRVLVLAASLALVATARPAAAQGTSEKAAQKAFEDGMKLLEQGKTAEACPKLEESQRLDPAMGTQFRLAECWEKLGRTASAWALFRQVVSEAQAAGRSDRAAVSVARATALEPRLTRILIVVAPSARVPGLIIRRDGAAVEEALFGHAVAVDPGSHLITATAPGKKAWEKQQQASSGTVEVTIPALEPGNGAPATEGPTPLVVDQPVEPSGPKRSLVPGVVLGGAALAGIGAGIALVVVANGKKDDALAMRFQIPFGGCDVATPACTELADTAGSAGNLSNAAFWTLLGSGFAAAGAVTYFLWPAAKPTSSSGAVVHVLPVVGAGGLGLSATGTF